MTHKLVAFFFCLALVAGLFGVLPMPRAQAAIIVTEWCFQDGNGAFTLTPNQGTGSANAGSGISPTNFTGNASITCLAGQAWSATDWTQTAAIDANDYFEFSVSTTGKTGITFMFDDRASGTGPVLFALYYSPDGVNFTPFATSQSTHGAFSTNPMNTFDLSSITALNDNANTTFRIFGYNASGTTGTWRIDNVQIQYSGTLAVTLTDFYAEQVDNFVRVTWETVSELDNAGFNLYRGDSAAAPQTLLAYVPSQAPGSAQGFAYTYEDLDVQPGETYWYWLEDVSLGGATTLHGPVSVTFVGPTAVVLNNVSASSAGAAGLPWSGALAALVLALTGALSVRRREHA